MTPVSGNSLLKEFLSSTNPNALLARSEGVGDFFYSKLSELRNYTSEFDPINHAIQQIPVDLLSLNVIEVLRNFNYRLAGYNKIVDPLPIVSSKAELESLEQRLNDCDQFLGMLWAALPISDKPELYDDITQIREWLENPQNQAVLDSVTNLDLKDCGIAQISKELFKLRNLEFLNISANELSILPPSIGQFKKLKKLKAEANYLTELPQEIGQCISLEILKVSENQISKLPKELKHLTSLKKFCISDNELELSSEDLEELELYNWGQIQRVDLSENPLKESITADFVKTLWPSATEIDL